MLGFLGFDKENLTPSDTKATDLNVIDASSDTRYKVAKAKNVTDFCDSCISDNQSALFPNEEM